MDSLPKCPKCAGDLEEGYLADFTENGARGVAHWIAGKPLFGFFGSAKISGKVHHPIRARRCVQCGFLELYAPVNSEH